MHFRPRDVPFIQFGDGGRLFQRNALGDDTARGFLAFGLPPRIG